MEEVMTKGEGARVGAKGKTETFLDAPPGAEPRALSKPTPQPRQKIKKKKNSVK